MGRRALSDKEAGAVYDVLVEHAGAFDAERDRWSFIFSVTDNRHLCREYRFCGKLGFGGKFRNNGNNNGVPYVDCYPEHETPERLATIELVNRKLAAIFVSEGRS